MTEVIIPDEYYTKLETFYTKQQSKDIINKEILYNLNIIDKVKNILNTEIIENSNFKKSEINENLKILLQIIKFDLSIYNITFIEKIQKVHTNREILSFNNVFFSEF